MAASLNDIVMAICAGALKRYLADCDCVPDKPLIAGVPVSLREAGNIDPNNQVSMMTVSLATNIADPLLRLKAINESAQAGKRFQGTVKGAMPTDFPSVGMPWLMTGLVLLYGRSRLANRLPPIVNVAISNVPGPQFPLYFAGARLESFFPVSIPGHGVALNIPARRASRSPFNDAADLSFRVAKASLTKPPRQSAVDTAGSLLRELREMAGLALSDLAQAIKLKDSSLLEGAEGGKVGLPFEIILRLAALLGRHDPISVAMNLTRVHNPQLWQTPEGLGIGRLAVQTVREREFSVTYRAKDRPRELSDDEFSAAQDFVRAAFEAAPVFRDQGGRPRRG
jgi:transcriptional regulator with XRE-family HTH domain